MAANKSQGFAYFIIIFFSNFIIKLGAIMQPWRLLKTRRSISVFMASGYQTISQKNAVKEADIDLCFIIFIIKGNLVFSEIYPMLTPCSLSHLLHGQEQRVYGDSAYASQKELIHSKAPQAKYFTTCRTRDRHGEVDEAKRSKSKIRARVEQVFGVVKRLWRFAKVHYRGLAMSACHAFTALALANIYLSRNRLTGQVRP